MAKKVIVGGRIESKEVGGIVTGAAEILDDTKGKKQNVINQETDAELERLDGAKQDVLTFDNAPTENSNNPVKSGGVYAADKALSDAIEAILLLIPSAASALNKLVDQATMNSSISTATATFRGTYNVVTDLELAVDATHEQIAAKLAQVVSEADNNDYAFVQVPVSAESTDIRRTERYKFNGTAWAYEYDLNTSGFTAAQWAAINSGITLALVAKLSGLPTSSELMALLGQKQDTLTFDNTPTNGSANPVKSGGVYSAINDEKTAREQLAQSVAGIDGRLGNVEEVIPSGAAANNKLVANSSMEAYVASIIQNITASFTIATADGHINLTLTQTNGQIASLTLTSSDIASAQALTALTGRVSTAEGNITTLASRVTTAEGNITTIGGRVSTNETDIANLQQLYNNLQQSKPVPVTALPSTGQQQGVIYRLAGTTSYSDYMWNGSSWVLMATYNNAIDNIPTQDSNNLVKSGGVFYSINELNVAVFGLDSIGSIETESGKYLKPDGTTAINPDPSIASIQETKTFYINNARIAYITGRQGTPTTDVVLACAYDSSRVLLQIYVGTASTNYNNYKITLPIGCSYLKVCNANMNLQTNEISCFIQRNGIEQQIQDLMNVLDYKELTSILTESGKYLQPNGSVVNSPSGLENIQEVRKYDVEGYAVTYITGRQGTPTDTNALACAYDSSDNLLEAFVGTASTNYDNYKINLPFGCKYLRVCNSNKNLQASSISVRVLGSNEDITAIMDIIPPVPQYWNTEINKSIQSILSNRLLIGNNIAEFIFITDTHFKNNAKKSPSLVLALEKALNIDNVIFGGDAISYSENTKLGGLKELQKFVSSFNYKNLFFTIGNHDRNNYVDANAQLTMAEMYATIGKQMESLTKSKDLHVSYFDNETQKVRFVQYIFELTDAQQVIDTFKDLPADWTVVIFTHDFWEAHEGSSPTIITEKETMMNNIIAGDYSCTIAAFIVGHVHSDQSYRLNNNIPVISTTTDCVNLNTFGGPSMTIGTDTEQAFDIVQLDTYNRKLYFTRVGAGSDREFSY